MVGVAILQSIRFNKALGPLGCHGDLFNQFFIKFIYIYIHINTYSQSKRWGIGCRLIFCRFLGYLYLFFSQAKPICRMRQVERMGHLRRACVLVQDERLGLCHMYSWGKWMKPTCQTKLNMSNPWEFGAVNSGGPCCFDDWGVDVAETVGSTAKIL